jgi:hypothetical protein
MFFVLASCLLAVTMAWRVLKISDSRDQVAAGAAVKVGRGFNDGRLFKGNL